LRREVEAGRRPWIAALPTLGGLAGLVLWQAGSLATAGMFLGASITALAVLALLARLAAAGARRSPRPRGFAWRQGLAGLRRPGGHATGVIVALGVGVMLLVAVALMEASLHRQVDPGARREAPSFFFVDIQPDQRDAFVRLVTRTAGAVPALTPVVRSRLVAVDGAPVTRQAIERRRLADDDRAWYFTRDYVLTWAARAPTTNVLSRGRWWTAAEAAARPRISIEAEAARSLGVDIGSTLTFDVQGVTITAEVMSLRQVDWHSLSTNFFVIFSPGALDGAPMTYIATALVPPARQASLQDAVTARFPNVAAVPVRDMLERIGSLLDRIALAVRALGGLTVAAGLVVLAGALAASRAQRLYESVVLRALGATRGAVARAFAVEYACLGAVAGVGGTLLAVALAGLALRFVLEIPPRLPPPALALGILLATGVALGAGLLATFRLLGRKPLPVLRQE
jgi:putative ABC transport system permease protein